MVLIEFLFFLIHEYCNGINDRDDSFIMGHVSSLTFETA